MQIKIQVMNEDTRTAGDKSYTTITGMEVSQTPLLQMVDYTLRAEESQHKGQLKGKTVDVQVENIRAIFAGRPQLSGKLLKVA